MRTWSWRRSSGSIPTSSAEQSPRSGRPPLPPAPSTLDSKAPAPRCVVSRGQLSPKRRLVSPWDGCARRSSGPRSRAGRCSRRTPSSTGPAIQSEICGTRSRCSASTAATDTSMHCRSPSSMPARPTCCASPTTASRSRRSSPTAVGRPRIGRRRRSDCERAALLDGDGRTTPRGRKLRARIEADTDRLSAVLVDRVAEPELVVDALTTIAATIAAAGVIPYPNPVGVPDAFARVVLRDESDE